MALFQIASREGLGPRLYAVFKNGYVAEFAKGRVLKAEEMREVGSAKQKAIVKAVARWHSLDVPSVIHAGSRFPFGALVELAKKNAPKGRGRWAEMASSAILQAESLQSKAESLQSKAEHIIQTRAARASEAIKSRSRFLLQKNRSGSAPNGLSNSTSNASNAANAMASNGISTITANGLSSPNGSSLSKNGRSLCLKSNVWTMMDSWLRRAKRLYSAEDALILASLGIGENGENGENAETGEKREKGENRENGPSNPKSSNQSDSATPSDNINASPTNPSSSSSSPINSSHAPHPSATNFSPTFAKFVEKVKATQLDVLPFYALSHARDILCHNDLNHGNLLYEEAKNQVWAVDLEFAGFNHRGFDLGNHFCEWASLELHYEHLPKEEAMRAWLHLYLEQMGPKKGGYCVCSACLTCTHCTYCHPEKEEEISSINTHSSTSCNGTSSSNSLSNSSNASSSSTHTSNASAEQPLPFEMVHVSKHQAVEEMIIECYKWMQVSHLFWWLWGMIQIKISNVEGFDAKNYCKVRWEEYEKAEKATKGLKAPSRLLRASPAFLSTFPLPSALSPPHSTTYEDGGHSSSAEYGAAPATRPRRRRSSSLRR